MFRRHKYVFTCPDTIYLRQKAKSRNRTIIGTEAVIVVAWLAYMVYVDRKETKAPLTEDTDMPYPNRTV